MAPKTYERVTNASFLLAVLSALLFERVASLRWLVGGFGILAGAVAVVVYFVNQGKAELTNSSSDECVLPLTDASPKKETELAKTASEDLDDEQLLNWNRIARKSLHDSLLRTQAAKRHLYSLYFYQNSVAHDVLRRKALTDARESSRYVDRVVQIVRRLCASDDHPSFEFTIARDGSFTIRTAKAASAWSERQSDLATVEDAANSRKPN
jgi:hypothetical protein